MVEMELTLYHIRDYFQLISARERYFARQKDIQDDTHRPKVDLGCIVLLKYLRRYVVGLYMIKCE